VASTDDDRRLAVTMAMLQWHVIDGTVDNEIAVAAPNGDPDGIVDVGRAIRQAGWSQLAGWTPQGGSAGRWPGPDETVTVVLSAHEWEIVRTWLTKWRELSRLLGQDTTVAEATRVLVEHALR